MANWENLKQAIKTSIASNGNQEITGALLQSTLLNIISSLGENATFKGIATTTTNPGTPDGKVFYITDNPGVYSNFNGIEIEKLSILYNNTNGEWVCKPLANTASLQDLYTAVNGISGVKLIESGRLDVSGQKQASSTGLSISPYYKLAFCNAITVRGYSSATTALLAFYDKDKKFISSISGEENASKIIIVEKEQIPSNAYYIRATGKDGEFLLVSDDLYSVVNSLENKTITNVSREYKLPADTYYTLDSARNAIPVLKRRGGHIIIFKEASQKWAIYQYQGNLDYNDTDTGWRADSLWKKIPFEDSVDILYMYVSRDYAGAKFKDGYLIMHGTGAFYANDNTAATEEYLPCRGYDYLRIVMHTGTSTTSGAGLAFYDVNKQYISGVQRPVSAIAQGQELKDIKIPEGAAYFRTSFYNKEICSANNLQFSCSLIPKNTEQEIKELQNRVKAIDYSLEEISNDKLVPSYKTGQLVEAGILGHTGYLDCAGYIQVQLTMPTGKSATSEAGIAFYDSSKLFISGVQRPVADYTGIKNMSYDIPEGAAYFRTCFFNTNEYGEFECFLRHDDYIVTQQPIGKDATKAVSQKALSEIIGFTENLSQDEVCRYFCIIGTNGTTTTANAVGCTRYVDCCEGQTFELPLMQISNDTIGYAFYDKDKNYIIGGSQKGTEFGKLKVVAPQGSAYLRFSARPYSWLKENDFLSNQLNINVQYPNELIGLNGKRPYQDGYIYFSVKVNQKVNSYWDSNVTDETTESIDTTTGVLVLPKNYTQNGKPVPLIMYCHGYSHGVWYDTWGGTDAFRAQKDYFASKGFAVFDCNGARDNNKQVHFTSSGSNQFVEGYRKCYEYIVKHYNVEKEIYVCAGSAGGPTGINYCYTWGKQVKCLALLSPWTDLYECSWNQSVRATFVEYLGFISTDNYEQEKTVGYDPKLRIIDGKLPYFPVPVKAWIGSNESGTKLYQPLFNFINALRSAGNYASICQKDGIGHELVSGNILCVDNEVMDWFSAH